MQKKTDMPLTLVASRVHTLFTPLFPSPTLSPKRYDPWYTIAERYADEGRYQVYLQEVEFVVQLENQVWHRMHSCHSWCSCNVEILKYSLYMATTSKMRRIF